MALQRRAFTMLEMIIVVAIISMLVAVAAPRLDDAFVRTQTVRATADLRSLDLAINVYRIDNSAAPGGLRFWTETGLKVVQVVPPAMTTPVAYLTSLGSMVDQFHSDWVVNLGQLNGVDYSTFRFYGSTPKWENDLLQIEPGGKVTADFGEWEMWSSGPDRVWGPYVFVDPPAGSPNEFAVERLRYDPTNGTVSGGDIMRRQ
jgi:prepilin-type N-terminal cleavage/methylation domain-containing protein